MIVLIFQSPLTIVINIVVKLMLSIIMYRLSDEDKQRLIEEGVGEQTSNCELDHWRATQREQHDAGLFTLPGNELLL